MPLRWVEGHDEMFARWCQRRAQGPDPSDQQVVQKMLDICDELGDLPLAESAWAWCAWLGPLTLSPQPFIHPGVSVKINNEGAIRISYPLPPAQAPWPNASVIGHADLSEEAVPMIAEALARVAASYAEFEPLGRPDEVG